jgi:hypothetical protein
MGKGRYRATQSTRKVIVWASKRMIPSSACQRRALADKGPNSAARRQ